MNAATRRLVRSRAGDCCEYCQLPQIASPLAPLEIEHIIPKKHHGTDSDDNLALACYHCNAHKGPNLAGIDPFTGELSSLFHPRRDVWTDHFAWEHARIVGLTAVGHVTVDVLCFNAPEALRLREALLDS